MLIIMHHYVLPIVIAMGPLARLLSSALEERYPRLAGIARFFAGIGVDHREIARGYYQARARRRLSAHSQIVRGDTESHS